MTQFSGPESRMEETMDVQLIIDPETCVGYGECVAEDGEAVELDGDGCARARPVSLDRARAERICAACPVGAITVATAARPPATRA
jgi:ferredoxin